MATRAASAGLSSALIIATLLIGSSACTMSEASESCLRQGEAEVCARRTATAVEVTAEGLRPGTPLVTYRSGEEGPYTRVDEDGQLAGKLLLLSAVPVDLSFTVRATAADGSDLAGTIDLPRD